jgi:Flp pilus assembly protein TadB
MGPSVIVFILLAGVLAATAWVRYTQTDTEVDTSGFERALAQFDGPLDAGMLKLARPIASTRTVQEAKRNPAFRSLEERVRTSGAYGGSFEVFIAVQVASLIVASAVLVGVIGLGLTGISKVIGVAIGAALAFQPWNRVSTKATERTMLVNDDLPQFVDLFLMPLASGLSLESALRFTVDFTDGPVAVQTRWLLDTLQARTMNDELAFREAGRRLGTPEAAAFFTALGQAHIEGARVIDTLTKQADALRAQSHQLRRARIKRIPVKMIAAFALHFLPLLFIMTIVPLLVGLKGLN